MTARAYVVDAKGTRAVDRDAAVAGLAALDPVSDLVWVHFDSIDEETETWLDTHGALPPAIIQALVATETRPRFEMYEHGILLNLRGLDADPEGNPDLLSSIRIWGAKGRIFSVSKRDLSALATLDRAFERHEIVDPGDFIATLAGAITTELDPDVAELGDTLDDCEEMFGETNALTLRRTIAKARARAIAYRRFVAPQRVAIETLAALDVSWLSADDLLHLREAADRAARMAEELEAIRERSALIHEQLTDLRGELLDTRGLVLSVVALVFLPLTFLTGLLGMNVDGIPYQHEPWAFAAVCGICVAIAAVVAVYFARAHWFK